MSPAEDLPAEDSFTPDQSSLDQSKAATSDAFQDALLNALVEDRAKLINENMDLRRRITELTAQVLALQMFKKDN